MTSTLDRPISAELSTSGFFDKIKKLKTMLDVEAPPSVQLAQPESEVYCEVAYDPERGAEAQVNWKIRNDRNNTWPQGMQLIPVLTDPSLVRMFF